MYSTRYISVFHTIIHIFEIITNFDHKLSTLILINNCGHIESAECFNNERDSLIDLIEPQLLRNL